jgi:succinate dehydrogenase / fumarate reductase, membrane anchor subunit
MVSIKTSLAKVKYLGSAKSGTQHFIAQRVTSMLMLPLVGWVLYFFISVANSDKDMIVLLAESFPNLLISMLFVAVFLYHGYLGMQVICEDYIHSKILLSLSLLSLKIICITTGFSYVLSLSSLRSLAVILNIFMNILGSTT